MGKWVLRRMTTGDTYWGRTGMNVEPKVVKSCFTSVSRNSSCLQVLSLDKSMRPLGTITGGVPLTLWIISWSAQWTGGGSVLLKQCTSRPKAMARQGRPPKFSSAPWLEQTDHDPVEMLFLVGKDWAGEAQSAADVEPRPDVLLFLGWSTEAVGLGVQYAAQVSSELSQLTATHVDWDVVAQVMRTAAIKVVGPTPKRRSKPWLRGKEAEIHELETAVHCCGTGE